MSAEYGPFWDEECLTGEIAPARAPQVAHSLFDTDLFCDEETLDSIVPEACPTPPPAARDGSIAAQAASMLPPSSCHYPVSECDSLRSASPWRTFMDDNCPLRRRVKVTITPSRKRAYQSTVNSTDHTPSPSVKRKRRSGKPAASPAKTQSVLHFPPQFGAAATAPRRLRIARPGCTEMESSNVLPRTCAAADVADSPGPVADLEALLPEHDLQLLGAEVGDAPAVIMVGAGGEVSDCEESGSSCPDLPKGYLTPALKNRLYCVTGGQCGVADIDSITCTSRLTLSSAPSRDSAALPRVGDAVLAVSRAARAFKETFGNVRPAKVVVKTEERPGTEVARMTCVPLVAKKRKPLGKRRAPRKKRALLKFEEMLAPTAVEAPEGKENVGDMPSALQTYVQRSFSLRNRILPPMP